MIYFLSLICLLLPAYLIRFSVFGIPTTVLEILIYITVLIQITIIVKSILPPKAAVLRRQRSLDLKSAPREASAKWGNILIPVVLLLLAGIISVFVSPDKRTSLGILKGWFFDPILLFGLIVLNVKTEKDFKKIIYGLAGGAAFVSLWGILQWFGFGYLLPHQQVDPFGSFQSYMATGRAFGPFESPNYLGMYLAPIAALTTGYWLKSKRTGSYFLAFSLCSMILALLFTKSLGAWLGFGVAAMFLVWHFLSKDKKIYFWLILSALLVTGIFLADKIGFDRIKSSFAARAEVWQVSWYLIKQHPILGIGLGTFPKIYNQTIPYIHFPPINWLQMHPHNIFLAFWLNLGLLGLISFIWILILFFKNVLKSLNVHSSSKEARVLRRQSRYTLNAGLIAAMIAIIAHGLIDTTYWKNDLSTIFWILLGLSFTLNRFNKNEIS